MAPRVRRGVRGAFPTALIMSRVRENRGQAADSAFFFIFAGRQAWLQLLVLAESSARGAGKRNI